MKNTRYFSGGSVNVKFEGTGRCQQGDEPSEEKKVQCTKCSYAHAPNQPECYRCEACGGKVRQDARDDKGREPSNPAWQGVTYPIFVCIDVNCGKSHFWD